MVKLKQKGLRLLCGVKRFVHNIAFTSLLVGDHSVMRENIAAAMKQALKDE